MSMSMSRSLCCYYKFPAKSCSKTCPLFNFQKRNVNTHHLFDQVLHRDISSLNSQLSSYVRMRDFLTALDLFRRLHCSRLDLDAYTFTTVLGACSALPFPERGRQVHCLMIKIGSDTGTVTKTALMHMCATRRKQISWVQMQLLFEFQELWTVVSEGIASPADAATTRKDIKARAECRSRKQNFQANVAEDGGRSETLLLACNMAEDGANNKWFLDSGCSNHMCGEKEMFTQLDESCTSSVKFGNDTTVPVMGKGKISITLKDGSQNAISDVLLVPNLHKNLLSVGQLSEKGYDIRIHEGICTINSAQKGLIAKVKMSQNRLFPLLINSDSLPCFSSVMCDENWLWHMRFGHVNFGSLKQLASRKMVSGLPSINPLDRVCETCVLGKKHRNPFPIGKAWRANVNVDLEEIVQEEPTHVTPPPCVTPYLAESSSRPQRQRVLPARLQDCVLSNDDYPTDEELVNFALFADCDPVTYEDAAQDDYWMKAMNEEIYLGLMSYFLGIEVSQTDDGIFLCQKKYVGDVLKKFKMEGCKPILTPVEERLKLVKDGSGSSQGSVWCFRGDEEGGSGVQRIHAVFYGTALVNFYSVVGLITEAMKVFSGLDGRVDDIMRNSLISGCIRNRKYKDAFFIMNSMRPNVVALTTALAACSVNSDSWIGKQIHCVALRFGLTFDTQFCNVLLDMYAKCGIILNARSLFDGIVQKDVSWTSMIDAYGSHGCGPEALELFRKMDEEGSGVLPNSVTFLAVLSACAHSGLVDQAREYTLGKAGQMDEVWCLFDDMVKSGFKATTAVWGALVNACKLNLDVTRGEFAAKRLLELEPDNPSYYILLSNFYATIGKWDAVDNLRNIMRKKGLVKESGSSWFAVANRHEDVCKLV
ncbi:hypothetical protein EZV62_014251 [Acer yangbiense]|uniref:GAG-pre-integrase domain-containing protein n=1 Tax=Acer yangbiense TaxID=1000413 RepID=A0A5C7HS61_9ROSI|nr:hypothetical protein EZV62_014251 [Acer yangbiense]